MIVQSIETLGKTTECWSMVRGVLSGYKTCVLHNLYNKLHSHTEILS